MTIDEAKAALATQIPKTRAFALVKDLNFAVKGGRVPGYVKPVADLLRITPIIRTFPDGRITNGGFLFGRRRRVRRFAELVISESVDERPLRIAIGHALCPADAEELKSLMKELAKDVSRITITELGSALGVHGGPGTLLVATMPEPEQSGG